MNTLVSCLQSKCCIAPNPNRCFDFFALYHRSLPAWKLRRAFCRVFTASALFIFFCVASLHAQVKLWGLTSEGGQGGGAIINLNNDGSDFQSFGLPGIAGAKPIFTKLLKAANGKFYGMTAYGGRSDDGVLFEYDPSSGGTYSVLHHFDPATGGNPNGSLIETGGKFYGLTNNGGNLGYGVLFEYDPSGGGAYNILHHFDYTNGGYPSGSLIASGGKFYGLTVYGGITMNGVLFEYDPSGGGTYSVLHHFDPATGGTPHGANLTAWGGKFYGLTYSGGSSNGGVLFEYDPSGGGVYSVLHHFDDASGNFPYGCSLIVWGGKFYGKTAFGGNSDDGVLFEYDPSGGGAYSVLHHFDDASGNYPYGSLTEWGGKFYGMTDGGGSSYAGVLFEYDPSGGGTYSVLHHFNPVTGGYPSGSLTASDGKFYGMTYGGGSSGGGVLFEFDPSGGGIYSVLVTFNSAPEGDAPLGSLIESGGKFYGMTAYGGSSEKGVLFEFDPDPSGGGTYNALHYFDGTNGSNPLGSLTASGGKFYGMTDDGGSSGYGVLFKYDPSGGGTYSVLHNFGNATGGHPNGDLTVLGGKFYGMTSEGGSSGDGVLFEYDPSGGGTYSVLHHFDGTTGTFPTGSLIASGGKLYGLASHGGSSGDGVLFEYDPSGGGAYSVLHEFDYTTGAYAYGSLVESGGKFYGMTAYGGSSGVGVLFEYNPSGGGAYSVLHDFDNTTGRSPSGALTASGGKFYGMTPKGGSSGGGVVFEYDLLGSAYSVLKHLQYNEGITPSYGSLLAVEASSVEISGTLIWEHDDATGVGNATVALTGDESGSMTTSSDGTFSFTPSSGSSFTITPTKTINKLNGVTTADATRIQQHVAGVNPITDFYKIVAADVNKSNSVTTQDASITNQALLGNPSALAQFKTSWRFVPTSHTMNNPPWGFPEKITITGVNDNMPDQDFFGIKTGDVITPFTNPANFNNPEATGFVLNAPDQSLQLGEQVTVTFSADQFSDLAALQFALKFDVEKLALVGIEPLGGVPVSAENIGTYNISEGEINLAWSKAEGVYVEEAAPIFKLTFHVLETGGTLSEALKLAEDVLEGHAYTGMLADNKVELNFFSTTSTNGPAAQPQIELLQNRPNPFVRQTTIGFVLPESCEAQLSVFDVSGRVLFSQQQYYLAGRHEEVLDLKAASGVLWYELTTPFGMLMKKMLVAAP